MRERCSYGLIVQPLLLLILCLCKSHGSKLYKEGFIFMDIKDNTMAPDISPTADTPPFLPLLAPSPLTPFTNNSVPVLSGLCILNFSAAESMLSLTATDCWASFAPYLANVVCCPQFDATLVILMGQSSKYSGVLALDATHAKHCLSDVGKILEGQGANENLHNICSIHPANLTEASCHITDINVFESLVDTPRLLVACEKIDPVKECCDQICQNAIIDAARTIALNGFSSLNGSHLLPEHSSRIDDCKTIVLRWLASKLDPSSANSVLRGLSNCKINKVCPLEFPDLTDVAEDCRGVMSKQAVCCKALENYVSRLQEQSFITNLQALNCAALLGVKLQKANVSNDLYNLCHINLKDFSLQVGLQGSGCLLPSLPSDATYDKTSGIGFICDLNDNIAALWPSTSFLPPSSCNSAKLPALPSAISAQSGLYIGNLMFPLLSASLMVLNMLI